jgi:hypothetical protein
VNIRSRRSGIGRSINLGGENENKRNAN